MFCVQKKLVHIEKKKHPVDKHRTIPMRFLATKHRIEADRQERSCHLASG